MIAVTIGITVGLFLAIGVGVVNAPNEELPAVGDLGRDVRVHRVLAEQVDRKLFTSFLWTT